MLMSEVMVEAPVKITRKADGTYTPPFPGILAALPWRVAIRQLNGQERFEAHQTQAEATHEVKGRYYEDLTPQHRLIFGEQILNIVAVDNVEMANVNHKLRCRELVK
jgi:SPP1 family predicted phage head-tail adaptor